MTADAMNLEAVRAQRLAEPQTAMIYIGKGKWAVIDREDYDTVRDFNWHLGTKGYAQTSFYDAEKYNKETNGTRTARLHRLILGVVGGVKVDHVDRNKLNNRRRNLRPCSNAENLRNRGACKVRKSEITSTHKGIYFERKKRLWRVKIVVDGRRIHGGRFKSETDAARKYNELAIIHHGEFACLNKVPQ